MNLFSPENLTALITLSAMEIVLGIDNIVFITILVGRVPEELRAKVRTFGIMLALVTRVALLFSISWIMSLQQPLFSLGDFSFSGRDLTLLLGGLFLIWKSTVEIHHKVEGISESANTGSVKIKTSMVGAIIFQIALLDIVFSLDSVITAVGMADNISIMVIAMVIAMIVMVFSANSIGNFVDKHPTVKILALSFLLLIGVMLVVESTGGHINKGYIYFAMAFSLLVEVLNIRYRMKRGLP